ncbi:hypothetical protein [Rubrivirga sp.]|uniref:hypothetical protein n=1 Tax=Rubrivirga sp. TaxID=1885344 RepID=UPI003C70BD12
MIAQLDHLTAIVVGAVLLLALFAVQQRSTTAAVEATLTQAARVHADGILEVVADDVENVLTPAQALLAPVRCPIRLTSDGERTTEACFTANVRTDTTNAVGVSPFAAGTVRYTLTPTRRMWLGSDSVDVFRLDRTTDLGLGTGPQTQSLGDVVDFDLLFVERDARVTEAAIALATAADVPASRSSDQVSTREALVHAAATVRPVNATTSL